MSFWLWLIFVVGAGVVLGVGSIALLPKKRKKRIVKKTSRTFWEWAERKGLAQRYPPFLPDRFAVYPKLERLERHYPLIRKECEELLASGLPLASMSEMGGGYTKGGVHQIGWKTFLLKSGRFVRENCQRAPETARLLGEIPEVANAFFSILEPRQHIKPHFGYYKGFLRYHLGLIIPNDNADHSSWIRVSAHGSLADRKNDEKKQRDIERGEKYFWHDGEGVLFDDTYLHEAANESDSIRVVLFVDLIKPLRFPVGLLNRIFVWLAQFDPSMRRIRRKAVVRPPSLLPDGAALAGRRDGRCPPPARR